jgi:hypothetical protein
MMLLLIVLSQCLLASASLFSAFQSIDSSNKLAQHKDLARDLIVKTTNGSISGVYLPTYNQDAFLGIPFAAPPIGSLRFRAPQPLNNAWNDVRHAKIYGPGCAQWGSNTDVKEDCLTLNSMYIYDLSPLPSLLKVIFTQLCDPATQPAMPIFLFLLQYMVAASELAPALNLRTICLVSFPSPSA